LPRFMMFGQGHWTFSHGWRIRCLFLMAKNSDSNKSRVYSIITQVSAKKFGVSG
jgi:hypothetical protein